MTHKWKGERLSRGNPGGTGREDKEKGFERKLVCARETIPLKWNPPQWSGEGGTGKQRASQVSADSEEGKEVMELDQEEVEEKLSGS